MYHTYVTECMSMSDLYVPVPGISRCTYDNTWYCIVCGTRYHSQCHSPTVHLAFLHTRNIELLYFKKGAWSGCLLMFVPVLYDSDFMLYFSMYGSSIFHVCRNARFTVDYSIPMGMSRHAPLDPNPTMKDPPLLRKWLGPIGDLI